MYTWIVYLHVVAAFAFLLAHGTSAFVALRLRNETNVERIRALLDLSTSTQGVMYISLLVILLTGIGGGFMGSWWGQGWIWASLGVFVLVIVLMFFRGSTYYGQVRNAVGLPAYRQPAPESPRSAEEIAALLKSSRPLELLGIGTLGLLALLYLMVFKPF
jgi:hypothetical protein